MRRWCSIFSLTSNCHLPPDAGARANVLTHGRSGRRRSESRVKSPRRCAPIHGRGCTPLMPIVLHTTANTTMSENPSTMVVLQPSTMVVLQPSTISRPQGCLWVHRSNHYWTTFNLKVTVCTSYPSFVQFTTRVLF